jgi:ankyrin repeat protein
MWGYKSSLKLLVAAGAECKLATNKSETAKDIASRYGHEDCVQFLECTEAKSILKKAINAAKDTLLDSERITGKWNKEDKSKVTALCNEKMDWVDRDIDYTKEEISSQLTDFEERYQPHLTKLDPL